MQLGPSKGITVNTVAPGPTVTDAGSWFPAGELRDGISKKLSSASRLGRVAAEPAEQDPASAAPQQQPAGDPLPSTIVAPMQAAARQPKWSAKRAIAALAVCQLLPRLSAPNPAES